MDSFSTWTFPFSNTTSPSSSHRHTSSSTTTTNPSSPRTSTHHRRQASITALPTALAQSLNAVPPVPTLPAAYRSSSASSASTSSSAAAAAAALTPHRGASSRHNRNYSITPSSSVLSYSSRPTFSIPSPTRATPATSPYPSHPRRQSTDSLATTSSRGSCSSSSSAYAGNALMAGLSEEPGEDVLIDSPPDEADSDDEEFWGCAGLVGGYDMVVKHGYA